ncbi:hypothetical protein DL546_002211 [Coniochaeta pulveracea]|uniref:Uncharacterized protein n=1 Tax=Coniochaeta pulveracea TaxID=177199 RepID=A0A420YDF5_9PEZI|nr:hypothetical protein DL546_002211 [Coniochaeta pulveracea]
MPGSDRSRVAKAEDADDSDNPIEGTAVYAESVASPIKQRSNTSRTRQGKPRRSSASPQTSGLTDSDSTTHPLEKNERSSRQSREFSSDDRRDSAYSKQDVAAMRPTARHAKTTGHLTDYKRADDPAYYGVAPAAVMPASSSSRPQAPRPASYYGQPARPPPPSNAGYYARHPPPFYPSAPGIPSSYPAAPWPPAGAIVYQTAPPMGSVAPLDYPYPPARPPHLGARFSGARPQSAMGHQRLSSRDSVSYDDYYEGDQATLPPRRPSRRSKADHDRQSMPPPPRPQTTRPHSLSHGAAFGPPRPVTPARRRSTRIQDDMEDNSPGLFQLSPPPTHELPQQMSMQRARRPSFGAPSTSYDRGSYRTEVAGRRKSQLGRHSLSSSADIENKMREAAQYQEDVTGPAVPLTAETLRRVARNGPTSSRSTRSSGSHDESDFKQSATTQTTRSSHVIDDDLTIRVRGNASLKIGGAEVRCEDGAELNISRNGLSGSYRGGSDRSSYFDPEDRRISEDRRLEDRRSRIDPLERPVMRTRTTSQSGSYARAPSRHQTSTPGPRYERERVPPPQYGDLDEFGFPLFPAPYPPSGYF